MCYNAVDRHVLNGKACLMLTWAGDGANIALIHYSAYLDVEKKISYATLLNEAGRFGSVLQKKFGVQAGDRVLIYMPMMH